MPSTQTHPTQSFLSSAHTEIFYQPTHVHMDTGRTKGQWGRGPTLLLIQDLFCADNVTHDVRTPVSIAEGTIIKEDQLGAQKTRGQEAGPWRNQGKLPGGGDI